MGRDICGALREDITRGLQNGDPRIVELWHQTVIIPMSTIYAGSLPIYVTSHVKQSS